MQFYNQEEEPLPQEPQDARFVGAASRQQMLGVDDGVQEPLELDLTDRSTRLGYAHGLGTLLAWHEVQATGDEVWRELNPEPQIEDDLRQRGLDETTILMIANSVRRDAREVAGAEISTLDT